MSFETLVDKLGLLFLFVGSGTEGEAVAVAGGALAHRGILPLWQAGLAVFGGSLAQGQLLFLAGRCLRETTWVRRVTTKPAYGRVAKGLARHPIKLALSFRFLFGLRSLTPLVLGTSTVAALRFALLNVVGALIWATVFVGLGYVFGTGIERLFGRLPFHIHLTAVVACAVVLLIGIWLWRRLKRSRSVEVV
jgi:membrane protein DedA with SNARE-associated domain